MGRRKRPQKDKYAKQFARSDENKKKRQEKHKRLHPNDK